jgi:hypothetical protein
MREQKRRLQLKTQTGYAPVNGLKMYHEIHGTLLLDLRVHFLWFSDLRC